MTQVMRENAKTMDALRRARSEKAQTMTAVEDFTSYGEITEVHADGIKKFVPVFSALYDSMSDAQKKNADTIFRRRAGAEEQGLTMKTSTAGKILVALAFASMIGGLSMGTALGEDNGRRRSATEPRLGRA